MLGRYIDYLPLDARARVRNATAWCARGYADASGARCLLGHAEDWALAPEVTSPHCRDVAVTELRRAAGDDLLSWPPLIGKRFDRVVARAGLRTAVRLVQARAARRQAELLSTFVAQRVCPLNHRKLFVALSADDDRSNYSLAILRAQIASRIQRVHARLDQTRPRTRCCLSASARGDIPARPSSIHACHSQRPATSTR
jgi:hypothetical protein